jgi:hypothetical protein
MKQLGDMHSSINSRFGIARQPCRNDSKRRNGTSSENEIKRTVSNEYHYAEESAWRLLTRSVTVQGTLIHPEND